MPVGKSSERANIEELLLQRQKSKSSVDKTLHSPWPKVPYGCEHSGVVIIHENQSGEVVIRRGSDPLQQTVFFTTEAKKHSPQPVGTSIVVLNTLANDSVELLKPIYAVVSHEDDETFIASFMDAGISSGGDTVSEAFESLQDAIAGSYLSLGGIDDPELGPRMIRRKKVLAEFICPSRKSTQKNLRPSWAEGH